MDRHEERMRACLTDGRNSFDTANHHGHADEQCMWRWSRDFRPQDEVYKSEWIRGWLEREREVRGEAS